MLINDYINKFERDSMIELNPLYMTQVPFKKRSIIRESDEVTTSTIGIKHEGLKILDNKSKLNVDPKKIILFSINNKQVEIQAKDIFIKNIARVNDMNYNIRGLEDIPLDNTYFTKIRYPDPRPGKNNTMVIRCILTKNDILELMSAIKNDYIHSRVIKDLHKSITISNLVGDLFETEQENIQENHEERLPPLESIQVTLSLDDVEDDE